jgi:hypothetical protein
MVCARRRKRGCFYEAKWGMEKECKEIIKQVWKEKCHHGDEWTTLTGKLEMCKASLTRWSKGKNENTEKEIANKCKLLEELQEKEGLTDRTQVQQSNVRLIYSLSKRTSTGNNVQENCG